MPHLVGLLPKPDSINLSAAQRIEKAQFDLFGALGE
jgi:hypothetical protein